MDNDVDIDVVVLAGSRIVDSIRRPVRELFGAPAVTYKRRLWPLKDGTIDIEAEPSLASSVFVPAPSTRIQDGGGTVQGNKSNSPANSKPAPAPQMDFFPAPKLAPTASPTAVPETMTGSRKDDEQDKVVEAPSSAKILVQAGPGSGKTEVTARRITKLIDSGVAPTQILVLSFSRSAIATLTRRLEHVGADRQRVDDLQYVAIRTFDAWAFRLLRLAGEQPSVLLGRPHEQNIEAAIALLSGPRQAEVLQLLGEKRHIFVDELQDLKGPRASLAMLLIRLYAPPSSTTCGFTVLGDRAQAIYGFTVSKSGNSGSLDIWTEVEAHYGHELKTAILSRNHRSTANLSAFSHELRLVLESELTPSAKLSVMRSAIASLPSGGEIGPDWTRRPFRSSAILTRTNGDAVRVVQKLHGTENGPPATPVILKVRSSSNLAPAWVSILLSRVKSDTISKNKFVAIQKFVLQEGHVLVPGSEESWSRLLHAADQSDHDTFLDLHRLRTRLSWPEVSSFEEEPPEESILVTTIHQAKGMEFDEVHVVEVDGAFENNEELISEEASVTFVGVTRAKKKLGRIPEASVRPPMTQRHFARGPSRLISWKHGWVNIEIGVQGDIASSSFIDADVHGSPDGVATTQALLASGIATLSGQKVVLRKTRLPNGHYAYDIHLQNKDNTPGAKLGRTTEQLTKAFLELLWEKNYSLPSKIWNLRIGSVGTMSTSSELSASIPEPWNRSRIWLGISLTGTGDFRSHKRMVGQQ